MKKSISFRKKLILKREKIIEYFFPYRLYSASVEVEKTYLNGSNLYNVEPVIVKRKNLRVHKASGEIQLCLPVNVARNLPTVNELPQSISVGHGWVTLPPDLQDEVNKQLSQRKEVTVRFAAA